MTALDHIRARPGATVLDVATATGVSVVTAYARVRLLLEAGLVEARGAFPMRLRVPGRVPTHCERCGGFVAGACECVVDDDLGVP